MKLDFGFIRGTKLEKDCDEKPVKASYYLGFLGLFFSAKKQYILVKSSNRTGLSNIGWEGLP